MQRLRPAAVSAAWALLWTTAGKKREIEGERGEAHAETAADTEKEKKE